MKITYLINRYFFNSNVNISFEFSFTFFNFGLASILFNGRKCSPISFWSFLRMDALFFQINFHVVI